MPNKEPSATLKFGLKATTIDKIISVLVQYPEVESAIVYGSRAKGNYRPGSDIDLTLTGSELAYNTLLRIDTKIDDLLLPYLFDISLLRQISNPDVVDHIRRIGIPLYEKALYEEQSKKGQSGNPAQTLLTDKIST